MVERTLFWIRRNRRLAKDVEHLARSAEALRLRLMYEANPRGWLMEQAGGKASDGLHRILEIQPTALHQRVGDG